MKMRAHCAEKLWAGDRLPSVAAATGCRGGRAAAAAGRSGTAGEAGRCAIRLKKLAGPLRCLSSLILLLIAALTDAAQPADAAGLTTSQPLVSVVTGNRHERGMLCISCLGDCPSAAVGMGLYADVQYVLTLPQLTQPAAPERCVRGSWREVARGQLGCVPFDESPAAGPRGGR